jgi:hypothetical protein
MPFGEKQLSVQSKRQKKYTYEQTENDMMNASRGHLTTQDLSETPKLSVNECDC